MAETLFKDTLTHYTIRGLMDSGVKTIYIRDASSRTEELYEAPLNIEIGDPCLRTRYKYVDGAAGVSRQVIAWDEQIVAWPGYEILSPGAGNDITALP